MDRELSDYISYLLRVWQTSDEENVAWRASLESPHTGERIGFANLDKLFTFLRQQTGAVDDSDEDGAAWAEEHQERAIT